MLYSGASQFDVSQFDSFAIRQLSCASQRMRVHRIVHCHLLFVSSYLSALVFARVVCANFQFCIFHTLHH
jgi:hypothetical protein